MKNILLIIICSLGINAYGQFPINQTTGSPTTLVKSRGGQGADSGFVYPTFLDTARMNGGFLKNIAGIMVRQGDTLWLRNKTATKWLSIIAGASSGTTYIEGNGIKIDGTTIRWADSLTSGTTVYVPTNLIFETDNSQVFIRKEVGGESVGLINPVGGVDITEDVTNTRGVKIYANGSDSIYLLSDVTDPYKHYGTDMTKYVVQGQDKTTGAMVLIPIDSLGGGGSGSIEYVVSGASIRVDSSGRTYTVNADTGRGNSQLITGASLNSVADSIGDLIDLKPNVGDVILNQLAKQTGKRFDIQSGKFDSLYASTATGLILANNSAAEIGRFGAGGGTTVTWQGLNTFSGGATINGTTTIGSLSGILKASTGVVGTAVSGTDLKTINGTSIIGSGDIVTPITDTTGLGALFIRNGTTHENKRFSVQSGRLDSILAASSAGLSLYSNSGTQVGLFGAGGGAGATFYGGVNIDGTTRLNTGLTGVLVGTSGTVSATANKMVSTFAKNATRDSAILTLADGTRLPVLDSVGGGGGGINYIAADSSYVGVNSGIGANGTDGGALNAKNILVGSLAGSSLTTGRGNYFIGNRAGRLATTSSYNIAIGDSAMANGVVTSGNNIGIGRYALYAFTTGTSTVNIAIGNSALATLTTGQNNVAIGNLALLLNTNNNNTAVGNEALTTNSTGATNTAVGYRSLYLNTTASNSTAVGYHALRNSTGANNTGLGRDAGVGISTGAGNVAIGSAAMATPFGGDMRITSTGNIAIGEQAMALQGATASVAHGNNIAIGTSALRLGATAVGNNIMIGYQAGMITNGFTGNNNIGIGSGLVMPSPSANNQISFWIASGYNALTRFTDGQWLINQTTSPVTTATASAALEINGVTRGFLPPRMTTTERNAIASPASSLVVANTSLQNGLNFYNGTAWLGTNQQVGNEAITGNKTISATTGTHLHMIDATSGNVTITLPTMAAGYVGVEYQFIRTDGSANTVTIQRAASNTINNAATSFTIAQFERAYVIGVNNSNTFTWHAGKFTNY